ncbi:STAS domain-containing protein [Candidatus Peregrinibacteria bacterium]|nr:STAS domain-containing protein [Candidatus Peregrinibacteria bacterium]
MSYQVSLLDVPEKEKTKVLYISGDIDESNLEDFKRDFSPLLETQGIEEYVLHLRDLQFINSMVIGYFAGVFSDLHAKGKKLVIAEGNSHILDILTLVGFTNLVKHYPTLQEAIEKAGA